MGLEKLVIALYSEKPTDTLYHYASLDGLMKIVQYKTIRATDGRYFSDLAEMMRHAAEQWLVMGSAIDTAFRQSSLAVKQWRRHD